MLRTHKQTKKFFAVPTICRITVQQQQARQFNWFHAPQHNDAFYKHYMNYLVQFARICPKRKFAKPGIYKLCNSKDSKVYIGQSVDMYHRMKQHVMDAFRFKYHLAPNAQGNFSLISMALANDNFEFEYHVQEAFPVKFLFDPRIKHLLNERERYWIEQYKSCDRQYGYNVVKGNNVEQKL